MKKLLSILLSALMVLSLVPVSAFVFADTGTTDWTSLTAEPGPNSKLYINNATDWSNFISKNFAYSNATVYLCTDIGVSSVTGIGPITDFKGIFDGQGFTVTGIKTKLFATISGKMSNVTLNLDYTNLVGNMIDTVAESALLSNVTVTGTLLGTADGQEKANNIIYSVKGKINDLTITNVQAYTSSEAGRYLNTLHAGSVIDGLTINGGATAEVHAAIGNLGTDALIKNLVANNFGRMLLFNVRGTVEGLTLDGCGDITIRKPYASGVVKNVVLRNINGTVNGNARAYSLIYPGECEEGFVIDGLTVEGTVTVPLFYAIKYPTSESPEVAFMNENLTIQNMEVTDAKATYLTEVRGTVDGLTVKGNSTASVIASVANTATLKNVSVQNTGSVFLQGTPIHTIATPEQWSAFLSGGNSYEGQIVQLTAGFDAAGLTGGPLADFKGYFNGGGFTVSNVETGVFTTLSGSFSNVTLNLAYNVDKVADMIGTVAAGALMSNVKVTGTLTRVFSIQTNNVILREVNGRINGLTVENVEGYTGGDEGRYIVNVNAGAVIDGLTFTGTDSNIHKSVDRLHQGALIKNLNVTNYGRTVLGSIEGKVDGVTVDTYTDILFRNPKSTGEIYNVTLRNVTSTNFSLIYPGECQAGFVIDGLDVDNTVTVPLFYPLDNVSYTNADLRLENVKVTNGAAVYLGELRGEVHGLTVNGNTVSVIQRITTGTLTGVNVITSSAPIVAENEFLDPGAELVIENAVDWMNFLDSNSNYAGVTVKLAGDLDVSGVVGVGPIEDFQGTFDGQNYTVSGVRTSLFGTLTGQLNNVDLELLYYDPDTKSAVRADLIRTLNGSVSNVKITGNLHDGTITPNGISQDNVIIYDLNGTVDGLTIENVVGYTNGSENANNGGRFIMNVNAGAEVKSLTLTGKDSRVHAAIGVVKLGATVSELTVRSFTRMVIFQLEGTIDNLNIDECGDITIRNTVGTQATINNLVIKNIPETTVGNYHYNIVYPPANAKLTIGTLTVDETVKSPVILYQKNAQEDPLVELPPNITIDHMIVNNGCTTFFEDLQGKINSLTVNGNTDTVIEKITGDGSVSNIVIHGSSAPVIGDRVAYIESVDDWVDFMTHASTSHEGFTVILMNDIDLNAKLTSTGQPVDQSAFTPIENFKGVFYGKNYSDADDVVHKITGIKSPLFQVMNGTITNVILDINYNGKDADLIGTMSGNLTNVTVKGALHDGSPNPGASSNNVVIDTLSGSVKGLTLHDIAGYTNTGGRLIRTISGTAEITDLTLSGTGEMKVQYMLGDIQEGAVLNNLVLDNAPRAAIRNLASGATINGLTCNGHNEIVFYGLNGTVNDLVINGGGEKTELLYRDRTTAAGTIHNLTVKNAQHSVLHSDLTDWPEELELTGSLVLNNSVFPFEHLKTKLISGKQFAGYFSDADFTNVIETLLGHNGDAYVKFVDPAMASVYCQLKEIDSNSDGVFDKYTVRFLTTVDRLEGYQNVTYKIDCTIYGPEDQTQTRTFGNQPLTYVYSYIMADGVAAGPKAITDGCVDSAYISAYEVRNIPASFATAKFSATATIAMADGSTITSNTPTVVTLQELIDFNNANRS